MSLQKEIKQHINSVRHEALLNIVHTANCMDKVSSRFFGKFDITEAQYNVMIVIKLERRNLAQVEISERMVSSRANITSLIDKLEQKGYVRRVAVDGDRRVYQVELTSAGLRQVDCVERQYVKAVEEMMAGFSGEEARKLSALLVKARQSLSAVEEVYYDK